MDAGIKLENRKIKPKNSVFFDDVTDILREEGYSKFWLRFRKNMHEIFDENEALKTKVEEMQKALEWYAEPSNHEIYEINEEQNGIITRTEYWTNVMKDDGERARQTLEGVKTK